MTERRLIFGSVAEQYDRYRPEYPPELVDYVLRYVGGAPEAIHVLEVGSGTGKATRAFAPLVAHVTAIEPDAEMIAAAGAHPVAPANVTHIQGDFEHADLPASSFELLISGTAWHWVSPELRNKLAARVLAQGGALAAFWNGPHWERSALRADLIAAYDASAVNLAEHTHGVMHPGGENALQGDVGETWQEQIADEALLIDGDVQIFPWAETYTAQEYCSLLSTHSDHIMLAAADRQRLLSEITAVINANGGSFEMPYRSLLCLARRA